MLGVYSTDDVVEVKSQARDRWGRVSGEAAYSALDGVRVEWGNRMVRDRTGETVVSSAKLRMEEELAVGTSVRINGRDLFILQCYRKTAFGTSVWEAFV